VELAKYHSVPLEHIQHVRGASQSTRELVLEDLSAMEAGWRRAGCRDPIMEYAFHWLRDNVGLAEGRRCLQHGDYRLHNVLVEGEAVTAILDWEHARVSNPADDLAYVRGAAEALGSWDEFMAAYVEAGGIAPDAAALQYYEAYIAVFIGGIHGRMEVLFNEQPTQRPLSSIGSALQYRPGLMASLYSRISFAVERS
jgi:aminoglycoside phosphotransferase (APT) family kinase protein